MMQKDKLNQELERKKRGGGGKGNYSNIENNSLLNA
jgi:hypothetical protein